MSCKIKRNPVTKEIEAVLAPNGEHSILFASINRIPSIPDKETAALVWAHTYTNNFKSQLEDWVVRKDKNGEPEIVIYNRGKYYIGTRANQTKLIPVFDGIRAGVNSSKVITDNTIALITAYTQDNIEKQESLVDHLNAIHSNSTNKINSYLAGKLALSMESNYYDLPIYYSDFSNIKPNWLGFYSPNRNFIGINSAKGVPTERTILHEAVHAITLREFYKDAEFRKKVTDLWELSKRELKDKFAHELRNEQEFMAEALTNPKFIEALSKIPVEDKSVWDIFKEFLADILDIPYNTVASEMFDLIIKRVENNDYYRKILPGGITEEVTPRVDPKTYTAESLSDKDIERDSVTNKYANTKTKKVYNSVTGDIIPKMQMRQFDDDGLSYGERKARMLWGQEAKDIKKKIKDIPTMVTFDEAAKYFEQRKNLGIAKGQIFHKMIHYYFTKDDKIAREIDHIMMTHDISKGEIDWMNEQTILKVIHRTGSNFVTGHFDDGDYKVKLNPKATDKILTELSLSSDILNLAGTVDLIIDHGNNVLSFYDVKTGSAFDRTYENNMFLFGNGPSEDIFVNARNKAKLQLMWYAIIAKVKDPKVNFRNLELIHIPNYMYIDRPDMRSRINVKDYLHMIENYLKTKEPKVYEQLKALPHFDSIFDPASYNYVDAEVVNMDSDKHDAAKSLQLKMLQLQSLVLWDKNLEEGVIKGYKKNRQTYSDITSLMKDIIRLKGEVGVDYSSWTTDMSWMDQYFGSSSYSTNPYVQLYHKVVQEQKQEAAIKYRKWRSQFDSHIVNLMREQGLGDWKLGIGSIVGGVNRDKLFSFMYKKYTVGDVVKTRFVTPSDPEWKTQVNTPAKEAMARFILDSVDQFFIDSKSSWVNPKTNKTQALANREATQRKVRGKMTKISNLDLARGSGRVSSDLFEETGGNYKTGWMPKYPPTLYDIQKVHGFGSKTYLNFLWNRYMTNYFEGFYDGWYNTDEAIPMKYLGGGEIDRTQNFTTDLELLMDNFVKQYYYKESLDQAYAFGNGLKLYLKSIEDADSNINFKKMREWFEVSINLHILGHKSKDITLTRRAIRRSDVDAFKRFNWAKFLRSLKMFFSGVTMWLKPVSGLANYTFAHLLAVKESVKNQIGNYSNTDFKINDLQQGFNEAKKLMLVDAMNGTWRNNKAFVLMDKFRYLPDNYDWFTMPNQLLTANNKLFTTRTMYMFHTIPEEYLATAMFVAQLNSMKTPDGKSVWDHYVEVKKTDANGNTYIDYEWDGTVRGQVNISNVADKPIIQDLTELSIEEINRIKFTYERIHGGYRLDERPYIEYFVWGELMIQFKKYLPSILKNIGASKGYSQSRGYFKEVTKDGVTYKQWTPDVIEGRWRMLFGMILNYLSIRSTVLHKNGEPGSKWLEWLKLQRSEEYDWNNLSDSQKSDMIDFLMTSTVFILMTIGVAAMWDRDEEDGLKKLAERITNDFGGNVNPLEVLRNTVGLSQPVAIKKSLKFLESGSTTFWSGMWYLAGSDEQALTQQGNLRGWKEFQRNVHFLSAYHDLARFFAESDAIDGPDFLEQRTR